MTTPDTEALRRVAKAATPGPWRCEEGSTSYPECDDRDFWAAVLSPYGREIVTLQERYSLKADDRRDYDFDAHHIATFDPPTVLALLDERDAAANRISELEARVGVLEGVLKPFADRAADVYPDERDGVGVIVKAGQLRAARAALTPQEKDQGL